MSPQEIKELRKALRLTQQQLAQKLGVSYVTLNRWENGQSAPSSMGQEKLTELSRSLVPASVEPPPTATANPSERLDFLGDANALRVLVEGERLSYGHLFNPAFAAEISQIDPLPHQRIAVYDRMLPQSRLRFLLADDAGAGKTIMTGLYIREGLSRRTLRRVLIVAPAGLVGNWFRELRTLFQLRFRIVTSADTKQGNPFVGPDSDRVIVSVDSLRSPKLFEALREASVEPYDLAVFDEAHKLSANRDPDGSFRPTDRYRLAEAIAGVRELPDEWRMPWAAHHLLLLTATPHMGKDYPYYCLWRLLEPELFSTETAFAQFPRDSCNRYFIRRVKEEMVDLNGKSIYPLRVCDTHSYELSQGANSEQALYDQATDYIRHHYNQARLLNRQAARFAMTVFQRRLASSTWALLCSFRKRLAKLDGLIDDVQSGRVPESELRERQQRLDRKVRDALSEKTAEEESTDGGQEEHEKDEGEALGAFVATSLAELMIERDKVQELIRLAEAVHASGVESKFQRMAQLLRDPQFANQKVILYTEHRDTLDFLKAKLEGMGYAGQVSFIHGGLNFEERDAQVETFRRPHDGGGEEHGARFFIGTDAAAEGINLQFCWILINYDIPWNPARLEQRMGRIHRYGQKKDRVSIINLVAGKTREGRVVKTLLDKLEDIRKQLGSDKVFDVVGRIFEGLSLTDYIQRAVVSDDDAVRQSLDLAGQLTDEQIKAMEERERSLFGDGGEVARHLPKLRESLAIEELRRLLPGYVRRYLEHAAPVIGVDLLGDLNKHFYLRARRPKALDSLTPLIESYPEAARDRFTVHRPDDKREAIFLHPGEAVFERLSALATERSRAAGRQGAMFTDVSAAAPYLFHVARISIVRAADPGVAAFARPEVLEQRLVGLRQTADGRLEEAPVEQMLLWKPINKAQPGSVGLIANGNLFRDAATEHLKADVARRMAELKALQGREQLAQTEDFLRRAYDYRDSELAAARRRYTEKARSGDRIAGIELERIKQQQRGLAERRALALLEASRAVELIRAGEVEVLATALVQPSQDIEDIKARDAEVERIAVEVVMAYEATQSASVADVSTPAKARLAGLNDYPGFDVFSRRATGERGIEVKGRVGTGDVELTENEWAKALNLREKYWLYVVFDCGTATPRLVRVQDPFNKLLARAKGSFVIRADDVVRAMSTVE